ncbi:type II toxin-antitoxin system HicA family toxin [Myxacorys almedinensis]|uniref:Addiction module toxin, HicA family n=1 Tax=Myxacorys almedinensis A TaxID=2690445 RepID=A0A8J7YWV1_9CYAN|nr:type II toxin-antitoxin system HicA family toxin [Myxacorys almedinensis]NDJ16079.1 addiction module toxin, HicA family [Myxacorys almedinensis A]
MPRKIREIKKLLLKAGFDHWQGKGSHQIWKHPHLKEKIVIAKKDGADAPSYLEKQVDRALRQIGENENPEEIKE